MTVSVDLAGDCTESIRALVAAVAGLDTNHVFVVTDENDLGKQIQVGVKTPFAGVIYGGLQAIPSADPSRQGRFVDLRVGVFYGLASRAIGNANTQPAAYAILTASRKAVIGQVSPSGHRWRFVSEAFLGSKNDAMFYAQHWATYAPLA